jgi:hypothetical protein
MLQFVPGEIRAKLRRNFSAAPLGALASPHKSLDSLKTAKNNSDILGLAQFANEQNQSLGFSRFRPAAAKPRFRTI